MRLLDPVQLDRRHRALVTILADEPSDAHGQTEGVNPLVAGSLRASSLLEPRFWVDRGLVFGKVRRLRRSHGTTNSHLLPSARYHIINRGNYRHDVFMSEGAWQAFIRTLGASVSMPLP